MLSGAGHEKQLHWVTAISHVCALPFFKGRALKTPQAVLLLGKVTAGGAKYVFADMNC